MIRIGIGLSLVVLAGFAATAAVDRRGEPAGQSVAARGADPAPGSLSLPAWHPPVLPEGHAAVLPPGHPPILPPGHPPVTNDVLTCPGEGLLPGRVPGAYGDRSAQVPQILSI
jgi:hypothetical protein